MSGKNDCYTINIKAIIFGKNKIRKYHKKKKMYKIKCKKGDRSVSLTSYKEIDETKEASYFDQINIA